VDARFLRTLSAGLALGRVPRGRPYPPPAVARLVVIGVAAGVFSALFGVGGGIVIVPLLVAASGYEPRAAAGTSLAAIGLIALAGVVLYGARGEVEVGPAALVGLPAAAGAVGGAVLQQRLATRTLAFGFAALLAVVGVRMLVA
jgi:uncharacterized membrane protein YfcA